MTNLFVSRSTTSEDHWRAIVLYGRNVASYKFALAKALIDLKPKAGSLLKMEDLAPTYAQHICRHLKDSPKQATSKSSRFLEACSKFNEDGNQQQLTAEALKWGFNNVIDAFHVVGAAPLPLRFYIDERASLGGLRITDEFAKALESVQHRNLSHEVEARWNLVESAWNLGLSPSMLTIQHENEDQILWAITNDGRRKSLASSRASLNGYQRGKCFYCGTNISIDPPLTADVDHFFPHALKQSSGFGIVDGIWNLVLSCRDCNRGESGKFVGVPSLRLLQRLYVRNEYYIGSHHPLRETLMKQTGATEPERRQFLNAFHDRAKAVLVHEWDGSV
jgi:hypothetical protein